MFHNPQIMVRGGELQGPKLFAPRPDEKVRTGGHDGHGPAKSSAQLCSRGPADTGCSSPASPASSPPSSPEFTFIVALSKQQQRAATADLGTRSTPTAVWTAKMRCASAPELFSLDQDDLVEPVSSLKLDTSLVSKLLPLLEPLNFPRAAPDTTKSAPIPSLPDIPSHTLLVILADLEGADLARMECVSKELCWPGGCGISGDSLPEEYAGWKVRSHLFWSR